MARAKILSLSGGPSVKHDAFIVTEFRLASGESMPLVVRRSSRMPDTHVIRYAIVEGVNKRYWSDLRDYRAAVDEHADRFRTRSGWGER